MKEHIVQIVKYVNNHHLPAASYKKPVVPQEVHWNTLAGCLQSYLDNWSTILKVCDDHRDNIDSKISKKVQDISIKRNAEDYLKCMKPIAVALDKVQSDTCKISDAVEVWKELSHDTSP